jgi:hypothetical protein
MKAGLFIISYEIGTGEAGTQRFELHLAVSNPTKKISGQGVITHIAQSTSNVYTSLDGDFSNIFATSLDNKRIMIVAEGSNNVKVRMLLNSDWSAGKANYSYTDINKRKINLENIPVKKKNQVNASNNQLLHCKN